jgi:hypothetical protein
MFIHLLILSLFLTEFPHPLFNSQIIFLYIKKVVYSYDNPVILPTGIVSDRASGNYPDPEILGTGPKKVLKGGGQPKPSSTCPHLKQKRPAVDTLQQWRKHEQECSLLS